MILSTVISHILVALFVVRSVNSVPVNLPTVGVTLASSASTSQDAANTVALVSSQTVDSFNQGAAVAATATVETPATSAVGTPTSLTIQAVQALITSTSSSSIPNLSSLTTGSQFSLTLALSTSVASSPTTPTSLAQSVTTILANPLNSYSIHPAFANANLTPVTSTTSQTKAPNTDDGTDLVLHDIVIAILVVIALFVLRVVFLGRKRLARVFRRNKLAAQGEDEEADWWSGKKNAETAATAVAAPAPAHVHVRDGAHFTKSAYAGILEGDDTEDGMICTSSTITRAVSDILAHPTPAHIA